MRLTKSSDSQVFDNYIEIIKSFAEKRQSLEKIAAGASSSSLIGKLLGGKELPSATVQKGNIVMPGSADPNAAKAAQSALLNLFEGLPLDAKAPAASKSKLQQVLNGFPSDDIIATLDESMNPGVSTDERMVQVTKIIKEHLTKNGITDGARQDQVVEYLFSDNPSKYISDLVGKPAAAPSPAAQLPEIPGGGVPKKVKKIEIPSAETSSVAPPNSPHLH